MTNASYEIINESLFVSGSLDRSSDADFQKALEKYIATASAGNQTVDMSNVRWLAPSSAKVLIQAGQETMEKGLKMRVLASRHVMQTLNLLGAKSWLAIESCSTPNLKQTASEGDSKAEIDLGPPPVEEAESAAPAQASTPAPAREAEKVDNSAAPSPTSSQLLLAVNAPGEAPAAAPAAPVAFGTLASASETLTGGANVLRALYPNRRYAFHFYGGEQLLGIMRGRVSGSWIMLDTHGTRKLVNLDLVQYCEML